MLNPVIFARGSSNRKPDFQLTTLLRKGAGGIEVSKKLANPQADQHLKSFIDKQGLLTQALIGCRVAKATLLSPSEVQFEFAKGVNLQFRFEQALERGKLEEASGVLDRVFALIDSFPKVTVNPSLNNTYVEIFGNHVNKPIECIAPACIDFNLDNLFDQGSKLMIVDYEWVYDFPVPVNFIKFRVLQSAFLETKNTFLKSMPEEFITTFTADFFLPTKLAERYQKICIGAVQHLETNMHFLDYIQIPQLSEPVTINKHKQSAKEFLGDAFPSTMDKLQRTLDKQRLDEEHIDKQDQVIRELQSKVERFEHTLTYKTLGRTELRLRRIAKKKP